MRIYIKTKHGHIKNIQNDLCQIIGSIRGVYFLPYYTVRVIRTEGVGLHIVAVRYTSYNTLPGMNMQEYHGPHYKLTK